MRNAIVLSATLGGAILVLGLLPDSPFHFSTASASPEGTSNSTSQAPPQRLLFNATYYNPSEEQTARGNNALRIGLALIDSAQTKAYNNVTYAISISRVLSDNTTQLVMKERFNSPPGPFVLNVLKPSPLENSFINTTSSANSFPKPIQAPFGSALYHDGFIYYNTKYNDQFSAIQSNVSGSLGTINVKNNDLLGAGPFVAHIVVNVANSTQSGLSQVSNSVPFDVRWESGKSEALNVPEFPAATSELLGTSFAAAVLSLFLIKQRFNHGSDGQP
jgi:hypothetical protein